MVIQLFSLQLTRACNHLMSSPSRWICFVREWNDNSAADLFPNLLATFLIRVPHHSIPEDNSLSPFYWYLCCDAIWARGLWQLTLQSSTWMVCCCARSDDVFVTCCQMPYNPLFIFLCSIFCTTKQKYVLLSHGRYGNTQGFEIRILSVSFCLFVSLMNGQAAQ